MTINVTIKHDDPTIERDIVVMDACTGSDSAPAERRLKPGESTTMCVHTGNRLIIEEAEAD